MEKEKRIDDLVFSWMGHHYTHKDLQEQVETLRRGLKKSKSESKEELSKEEVTKEWSRLATFMARRK